LVIASVRAAVRRGDVTGAIRVRAELALDA
jgi:hypothetical protein